MKMFDSTLLFIRLSPFGDIFESNVHLLFITHERKTPMEMKMKKTTTTAAIAATTFRNIFHFVRGIRAQRQK